MRNFVDTGRVGTGPEDEKHVGNWGAAVHHHSLDRLSVINGSLKRKLAITLGAGPGMSGVRLNLSGLHITLVPYHGQDPLCNVDMTLGHAYMIHIFHSSETVEY